MYWESPRTPCSGPKSRMSCTPGAARRRSAAWRSRRSTAVGLQTRPTRRPRSGAKRRSASTSSPGRTGPPPGLGPGRARAVRRDLGVAGIVRHSTASGPGGAGRAGAPGGCGFVASSRPVSGASQPGGKPLTGPKLLGLVAIAAGLHLALDGLAWLIPYPAPRHLPLRYAPEFVRDMVGPLGVGIAASIIWGLIAVMALAALGPGGEAPARRVRILAAVLWGFWLLSEGLMALVWLDAPWVPVLGGLAAGIPRSVLVAWVILKLTSPGG